MDRTTSSDLNAVRKRTGHRILIAEDTPSSRDLLRSILEADGYEVIEAEDGEQALELAFASEPDLIILDLHMLRLDGHAGVRRLRESEEFQKTPIVALTAAVSESMPEKIARSGFSGYLAKPIGPAKLRAFVAGMLNRTSS